ncbi:MAG: DUF3422 domain-containing protein [Methylococcales bacterium]
MTILFPIPENHNERFNLHNEVHARAPITLKLPVTSSFIALSLTSEERKLERIHLKKLCDRYNISGPKEGSAHFHATLDSFKMSWEQHAEFSAYSFYDLNNTDEPFSKVALEQVPIDWLSQLPGKTMVAAHASIISADMPSVSNIKSIAKFFSGNSVVGSEVSGGAARAFTDFKIHADGFSRFLILDSQLKPGQAGRLLQRLFEIEVYRVMALLAFPIAKQLAPELNNVNQQLLTITSAMAHSKGNDNDLLDELTTLAAQTENNISTHQYRFDAASAYYKLVEQRIEDLREMRIQGLQTIGEFMNKRLAPAINTCTSTSNRFNSLSKRINNAGQLLRTRVDMIIERQNQALLTSMDLRAKMQLRLQETVEGLSIVAITSYIVSLIGTVTKAANTSEQIDLNPTLITGLSIPVVLFIVALAVRRIHNKIHTLNDD